MQKHLAHKESKLSWLLYRVGHVRYGSNDQLCTTVCISVVIYLHFSQQCCGPIFSSSLQHKAYRKDTHFIYSRNLRSITIHLIQFHHSSADRLC